MAKFLGFTLLLAVSALAEPPVGRYLPPQQSSGFPSNTYGAPSSFGGSSSFGGQTSYRAPSPSYSAPSSSYGAPSSTYGAPSSSYGAPGGGGPRNTYAPSAAKVSLSLGGGGRSSFGSPSGSYGAPAYSAPSNSYGPPSSSYGAPSSAYGAPGGGYQNDQSEPANYAFSYDVLAPEYNVEFGHQESRQHETAKGSYYVLLPDGRKQKVEYIADENGYRPTITYTEAQQGGYPRGPSSSYGAPKQNGGYQY